MPNNRLYLNYVESVITGNTSRKAVAVYGNNPQLVWVSAAIALLAKDRYVDSGLRLKMKIPDYVSSVCGIKREPAFTIQSCYFGLHERTSGFIMRLKPPLGLIALLIELKGNTKGLDLWLAEIDAGVVYARKR